MRCSGLALVLVAWLSGCAYNVQPAATRPVNIYSSYEAKIPGRFAVVLDDSLRGINREVRPSSYVCSAHTYPVSLGDTVSISVKRTLEAVFEETVEQSTMPTFEVMKQSGLRGVILVKMDEFSPRIICQMGFWTGTCTSTTDIAFGVTVRGLEGGLVSTGVAGSRSADGDSGAGCAGGSNVLSESITRATKDALERMAERLANAQKLRPASGS